MAHSLSRYRLASLPQSLLQACATKALLPEGNTIPTGPSLSSRLPVTALTHSSTFGLRQLRTLMGSV